MKTLSIDAGLATGFAATERGSVRREGGAGFAGLLDGERQRLDARPEARNESPKEAREEARASRDAPAANAQAAQAERRQLEARREQAQSAQRADREEAPRAAERPAPAQAKPGNEPTPQRAGLPSAKRPESPREAPEKPEATPTGDAEPVEASTLPIDEPAAAAAEPAADALLFAPASVDVAGIDAASRWSSTLALQMRGDGSRGPGGDAIGLADPAKATAAVGGRVGADARASTETIAAGDIAAPMPKAFEAALDATLESIGKSAQERVDAPSAGAARVELPALLPVVAAQAPSATASAPLTAQVSLPAPMESPEFGPQLGFQLASFVDQGVQQAQLQLNPADMGPVAVHIVLDGNQAQIDFTAAQQRTRDVLEAHWPALAAALHGAGFTLGGGGVSEQRSQHRDANDAQGDGTSRRGVNGVTGDDAAVLPRTTRVGSDGKRGLLDLYA